MPAWIIVVIIFTVAGGFFACFSYLKNRDKNARECEKKQYSYC